MKVTCFLKTQGKFVIKPNWIRRLHLLSSFFFVSIGRETWEATQREQRLLKASPLGKA